MIAPRWRRVRISDLETRKLHQLGIFYRNPLITSPPPPVQAICNECRIGLAAPCRGSNGVWQVRRNQRPFVRRRNTSLAHPLTPHPFSLPSLQPVAHCLCCVPQPEVAFLPLRQVAGHSDGPRTLAVLANEHRGPFGPGILMPRCSR